MHKNKVWLVFFAISCAITLVYNVIAVYKFYAYSRLTETVNAAQVNMQVLELSSDKYSIQADYTYFVADHSYDSSGIISNRFFVNRYAADQALTELSNKPTLIWYSPVKPNFSALHHDFPYRDIFYAIALIALQLYFTWIGIRVGRIKGV
jgi:hypothetical protein